MDCVRTPDERIANLQETRGPGVAEPLIAIAFMRAHPGGMSETT